MAHPAVLGFVFAPQLTDPQFLQQPEPPNARRSSTCGASNRCWALVPPPRAAAAASPSTLRWRGSWRSSARQACTIVGGYLLWMFVVHVGLSGMVCDPTPLHQASRVQVEEWAEKPIEGMPVHVSDIFVGA